MYVFTITKSCYSLCVLNSKVLPLQTALYDKNRTAHNCSCVLFILPALPSSMALWDSDI